MRIKVVSPSTQRAQHVANIVRNSGPGLDVMATTSPISGLPEAVNGSRPALLVLDGVDTHGLETLGELVLAQPDIDAIIISAEQSPAFLLKAMQAGVREVLPPPVDEAALQAAVQRVARKRRPVEAPAELGEVMAFVACKGGSGASFLAANLAHLLSVRDGRTVALIDLDLQFGDALLMLSDQSPASDIAEVARSIARLDAELLRAAMVQVSGTLSVLAAPEELTQALEVQGDHIGAIIKQARQMFDFVVIDVGRSINAVSLRALDAATHIFPVLQLNVPNVRDAKRLRDLFRTLDYAPQKIHWLVNRYEKNGDITLDSLQHTLGVQRVATVPNHFAGVSASVNQGVPIGKLARNNPVSRALVDLTQRIAPVEKGKRDTWFSTIFGN
ncbi:AAA family ATPase [Piscinibacter sp.]|uniref:AAA family ATPase n=1 Tax=Piscinibacter sp. TaxID=1903157 RepID=UPI002B8A5810|nr:AAA family ATPase [Albitalea sp.]HUG26551.1 AAA family ATPase [Albitalea sp.]